MWFLSFSRTALLASSTRLNEIHASPLGRPSELTPNCIVVSCAPNPRKKAATSCIVAPYGKPLNLTCAMLPLPGGGAPLPPAFPTASILLGSIVFDAALAAARAASCRRCSAAIRCCCPGLVPPVAPTTDENLGTGGVLGGAAAAI
jgi:hypothetical protein